MIDPRIANSFRYVGREQARVSRAAGSVYGLSLVPIPRDDRRYAPAGPPLSMPAMSGRPAKEPSTHTRPGSPVLYPPRLNPSPSRQQRRQFAVSEEPDRDSQAFASYGHRPMEASRPYVDDIMSSGNYYGDRGPPPPHAYYSSGQYRMPPPPPPRSPPPIPRPPPRLWPPSRPGVTIVRPHRQSSPERRYQGQYRAPPPSSQPPRIEIVIPERVPPSYHGRRARVGPGGDDEDESDSPYSEPDPSDSSDATTTGTTTTGTTSGLVNNPDTERVKLLKRRRKEIELKRQKKKMHGEQKSRAEQADMVKLIRLEWELERIKAEQRKLEAEKSRADQADMVKLLRLEWELDKAETEQRKLEAEEATRKKVTEELLAAEKAVQQAAEERARIEREVREKIEAENRAVAALREAEDKREKELATLAEMAVQNSLDKLASLAKDMMLREHGDEVLGTGHGVGRRQFRVDPVNDTVTKERETRGQDPRDAGTQNGNQGRTTTTTTTTISSSSGGSGSSSIRTESPPGQRSKPFTNGDPRSHSTRSFSPSTDSEVSFHADYSDHEPPSFENAGSPTRVPPETPSPPCDGANADNQGAGCGTSTSKTSSHDDGTSSRSDSSSFSSIAPSRSSSPSGSSTLSVRKTRKQLRIIREEMVEPIARLIADLAQRRRTPSPLYRRFRPRSSTTRSRYGWSTSDRFTLYSDSSSSGSQFREGTARPRRYREGRPRARSSDWSGSRPPWVPMPPPPSLRSSRRGSVDHGRGYAGREITGPVPGPASVNEPRRAVESRAGFLELVLISRDPTHNSRFDHGGTELDTDNHKAKDKTESLSDSEYETANEG
ncbi:uncharacterized protein B0T15DRAFT_538636 [Chaetomium strumarium]|uniref:Uncharacterized protein n=1 Tax=Chaetomium strumarium TaxID=1170767 RepID=A0AAJ0GN27_9PEZI|nr:hypothetical protein B0T15DRAFT_538636 [Chaetomium strumarium]